MSLTNEDREQIKFLCNKCEAVAKAISNHTDALAILDTHIEDIYDGLSYLADRIVEKPKEIKDEN